MDVVGHQAIGPAPRRPACGTGFGQQIAIERVVVVAEEHPLAPVAALGDVMGQTGDDETGDAGHDDLGVGDGGEDGLKKWFSKTVTVILIP